MSLSDGSFYNPTQRNSSCCHTKLTVKVIDNTCIEYLTGGHIVPFCSQQDRVSLYTRVPVRRIIVPYYFSQHVYFRTKKKSFTSPFSQFQGSLYIVGGQGDLQAVNVVQYQQHVHKMKVLSGNRPSCDTPNRCCCKN
jgi:hypothetical protein